MCSQAQLAALLAKKAELEALLKVRSVSVKSLRLRMR